MITTILSFSAVAYFGVHGGGVIGKLSGADLQERTKLTILAELPQDGSSRPDGDSYTLNGLTQWIARHISAKRLIQLDLINHDNRYSEELEDQLSKLITSGRKYFLCIGSPACTELSEKFATIATQADILGNQPILITTNAYGNITTLPELSYRFSPNNIDEAQALVAAALSNSENSTASFIASDDAHGQNAADSLMKHWRNPDRMMTPGIFVDSRDNQAKVQDYVSGTGMQNDPPDALFIATSMNINKVLLHLSKNTKTDFLFSSVYPQQLINDLIDKGIDRSRIYQAELDLVKSAWGWKPQYMGEALLYLTLQKLNTVLEHTKGEQSLFHKTWMNTESPESIKFTRAGDADFSFTILVRNSGNVVSLGGARTPTEGGNGQ
jgi:hypothetical protein